MAESKNTVTLGKLAGGTVRVRAKVVSESLSIIQGTLVLTGNDVDGGYSVEVSGSVADFAFVVFSVHQVERIMGCDIYLKHR